MLPASVRTRLLTLGRTEEVVEGAQVLQKDALDSHLLIVEAGELRVELAVGRVAPIGPGGVVGEMAFLENTPRTENVVARRPSRVRRVERLELFSSFAAHPAELKALLDSIYDVRATRREAPAAESAADYVARLAAESLRHRAVRHPYLQALGDGTLPDTRFALHDFAKQYFGYSAHFPRYLTTVISRLVQPAHRKALLENLTEESGVYGDDELAELANWGVEREWIEGIPHPILFRRFSDAIGVVRDGTAESDQLVCWREQFLQVLGGGSAAEAVGALGLGTENIVSTMYGSFTRAIACVPDLSPRDTVFFPLHTAVDDHHQATLQAIAADYAETEQGRADLRRGMLKALQLRTAFWDWLYARAIDPANAEQAI